MDVFTTYEVWLIEATELTATNSGTAIGITVRWGDSPTLTNPDLTAKFYTPLEKLQLLESLRQLVTMLEADL